MNLKIILITLSSVAAALIIVAFYVVFYSSGGTYVVGTNTEIFSTSTASGMDADINASSTASSSLAFDAFSTDTSTDESAASSSSTTQIAAAPVTWTQGNETLSVTDAALAGSQLTLNIQIEMGGATECVPLNLRMVADELGDLSPPITSQFTFPDTGTCTGTAGETYSAQPIVFTVTDATTFPVIFTTGGTANMLFEITQNADGSLNVQLPPQTD